MPLHSASNQPLFFPADGSGVGAHVCIVSVALLMAMGWEGGGHSVVQKNPTKNKGISNFDGETEGLKAAAGSCRSV